MGGETYVLPGPENRKNFKRVGRPGCIGPGGSLTADGRRPWWRVSAINVREFVGRWPIAWSFGAAENWDSLKWVFRFGQRESSPNASWRKEKFRPVRTGQYSVEAPSNKSISKDSLATARGTDSEAVRTGRKISGNDKWPTMDGGFTRGVATEPRSRARSRGFRASAFRRGLRRSGG